MVSKKHVEAFRKVRNKSVHVECIFCSLTLQTKCTETELTTVVNSVTKTVYIITSIKLSIRFVRIQNTGITI